MKADPTCRYCQGTGIVTDWVDCGNMRVPLETTCSCAVTICPICGSDDTYYVHIEGLENRELWHCANCGIDSYFEE